MSFFHRRGRRPRRPVTFDLIKTSFSNRRAGVYSRRDGWFDLSMFCLLYSKLILRSFLVRTRNEPKKPPKGVPLGTPSAVRILRCERGQCFNKPRHLCDKIRSQRLCVWFGCCCGGGFWLKIIFANKILFRPIQLQSWQMWGHSNCCLNIIFSS